jgi:hypothetical protein
MPVVLLCHCDGTNGSTTFTDVSLSAHALSVFGSAFVSNTAPKFGTGAATFSGTGGITVGAPQADFNFGAGQFTVEAWCYFTTTPTGSNQNIISQWGGSSNLGWYLAMVTGTPLRFAYSTTGTDSLGVAAPFTPTLNQWYHIAADRNASNVLRVYVNGAVVASSTVSATFFASTQACVIGNDTGGARGFPGYLDEVRVTKGTAQYGGAFTPPTGPFGGAASTVRNPITFVVS